MNLNEVFRNLQSAVNTTMKDVDFNAVALESLVTLQRVLKSEDLNALARGLLASRGIFPGEGQLAKRLALFENLSSELRTFFSSVCYTSFF